MHRDERLNGGKKMYRAIQYYGIASSRRFAIGVIASIVFMINNVPIASADPVNTGYFGGAAIMGYDPVAYFTESRATKGSEEFSYDWLGTPWQFANSKHRDLFMDDPAKYAPQYGGYCVGEVAFNGDTINIDPEAWAIIDGKLYLGYSKIFMAKFEANPNEFLAKAEANWPTVKAQLEKDQFH
jgi:YHS domain-containing protein